MNGNHDAPQGLSPSARRRETLLRVGAILTKISDGALYLAGFGLVAMTVLVAYQVFSRFILNSSPSWTETSAIMIMSWFIFLGAAIGVRENFHMGFRRTSLRPAAGKQRRSARNFRSYRPYFRYRHGLVRLQAYNADMAIHHPIAWSPCWLRLFAADDRRHPHQPVFAGAYRNAMGWVSTWTRISILKMFPICLSCRRPRSWSYGFSLASSPC